MEERGPERLLRLAYGNHPKSAALKPEATRVLKALRDGAKTIEELAGVLGVNLETPGGRKHFYVVMRPLREAGMISTRRAGGKTLYYLSYDGFSQYLREIRKEAEYWLTTRSLQE